METQFDAFRKVVFDNAPATRVAVHLFTDMVMCQIRSEDACSLDEWSAIMDLWFVDKLLLISARTRLF